MFARKTVFVVGAGGSAEVGLPLGSKLRDTIGEKLAFRVDGFQRSGGDQKIDQSIRWMAQRPEQQLDPNECFAAAQAISEAMPISISIDNFLHTHSLKPDIVRMGKIAIAATILQEESKSHIYFERRNANRLDFRITKPSWHSTLFQILLEDIKGDKIERIFDNVSFITFNYDRCIEHYFAQALGIYLRLPEHEGQQLANKLTVLHPFGQVGALLWQPGDRLQMDFGGDVHANMLPEVANQIRTFTERDADKTMVKQMRRLISEADQIVYLGFSYHPLNLSLLGTNVAGNRQLRLWGTTIGMSEANAEAAAVDVRASLGDGGSKADLCFRPLTCDNLLKDFWRPIVR